MGRALRFRGMRPLVTPPLQFSTARPTYATQRVVTSLSQWNQALADLQSGALSDAGNCQIALAPGLNLVGAYALPVRPSMTGWVEIITALTTGEVAANCPEGTRITPFTSAALNLASFELPGGAGANGGLSVADGASGYRISLVKGICTGSHLGLWRAGTLGSLTDLSHQVSRVVFDRVYLPGDPTQSQRRGIALTGRYTAVVDSWIQDFYYDGADSQAIAIYGSEGPYKIDHSYLDGWSEVILIGGAHSALTGLHEVPSDITITRNRITKQCERYGTGSLYANEKNAIELKSAQRVLLARNIVEHTQDAAQTGTVLLLKSTNQDGVHPLAGVQDVEVTGNLFRLAGTGVYLAAKDGGPESTVCNLLKRVWIHENLLEDLNSTAPYLTLGRPLQILGLVGQITYEHNTDVRNVNATSIGLFYSGDVQALDYVRIRSSIQGYGLYGAFRDGSTYALPASWPHPTSSLDRMLWVGTGGTDPTTVSPLPGTNALAVASDAAVGYVDWANRNYALAPGSPGKGTAHDGLDIGITDFAAFTAGLVGVP